MDDPQGAHSHDLEDLSHWEVPRVTFVEVRKGSTNFNSSFLVSVEGSIWSKNDATFQGRARLREGTPTTWRNLILKMINAYVGGKFESSTTLKIPMEILKFLRSPTSDWMSHYILYLQRFCFGLLSCALSYQFMAYLQFGSGVSPILCPTFATHPCSHTIKIAEQWY